MQMNFVIGGLCSVTVDWKFLRHSDHFYKRCSRNKFFRRKKNNNKSRVLNLSVEMQNNFYFQVDRHLKMKQQHRKFLAKKTNKVK